MPDKAEAEGGTTKDTKSTKRREFAGNLHPMGASGLLTSPGSSCQTPHFFFSEKIWNRGRRGWARIKKYFIRAIREIRGQIFCAKEVTAE